MDRIVEDATAYLESCGWQPFDFQVRTWHAYAAGKSGLLNAPTGSGKTYALFLPLALTASQRRKSGLKAIWITPIRALSKEILLAAGRAVDGLNLPLHVESRTGDTLPRDRQRQLQKPPDLLITTPESLHVILASKGYSKLLRDLDCVIVDEWHELMGSKRGVLIELALSRLRGLIPHLRIWGISATIGNMEEAIRVLHGPNPIGDLEIIRADMDKKIEVISIEPEDINKYPWAGYIGIRLLKKVVPIIHRSTSCLIFTNTRSQCEIWYQALLDADPDLAGVMAMHHGSISRDIREWVEDSLHNGTLKAVVSTSSLDLGVDFRPVETVIQVGSPKGVARFMQRAGRSGHQPGAVSRIYFVPTHALELIEGAALRKAVEDNLIEDRIPYVRSFDVLIQYLMTLAVSEGFISDLIFDEVKNTFSFCDLRREEWNWILDFLMRGGNTLGAYDEYQRLFRENNLYKVVNQRIARRHRLSIGTIVSDISLDIRYMNGKRLGTIEESFISHLSPGDIFWFAGRSLEFVRTKEMTALVKPSTEKKGKIPSWQGGRMPLSSQMSRVLRREILNYKRGINLSSEFKVLQPILKLQMQLSHLPDDDDFLIELFQSNEGHHLLMYPFEGRFVHEGMSALMANRLSRYGSFSFSLAMNDYGFELLTDQPIPLEEAINDGLFDNTNLRSDIEGSINSVEMARRKFREIARIAGLVFAGFPGKPKKEGHLQASSEIIFDVFQTHDPDNLLYLQTFDEVVTFQLEEERLRAALSRIQGQNILIATPSKPTPLSFPIMVDRLRERFTNEEMIDRVQKMRLDLLD